MKYHIEKNTVQETLVIPLFGRLVCSERFPELFSDPEAKRIVMASHCDSVKNGGNYDGILGVMSAMEVLEAVVEQNIPHKHPLTAMIWTGVQPA